MGMIKRILGMGVVVGGLALAGCVDGPPAPTAVPTPTPTPAWWQMTGYNAAPNFDVACYVYYNRMELGIDNSMVADDDARVIAALMRMGLTEQKAMSFSRQLWESIQGNVTPDHARRQLRECNEKYYQPGQPDSVKGG